jgi:hypothetical protein
VSEQAETSLELILSIPITFSAPSQSNSREILETEKREDCDELDGGKLEERGQAE